MAILLGVEIADMNSAVLDEMKLHVPSLLFGTWLSPVVLVAPGRFRERLKR